MYKMIFIINLFLFTTSLLAEDTFIPFFEKNAYEIKVELNNFQGNQIFLANYYGEKAYIKDSIAVNEKGFATIMGEEALEGGVYLLVLPPDNQQIQILIDQKDQHFTVKADAANLSTSVEIFGSLENKRFYNYLKFLQQKNEEVTPLRKKMEELENATEEDKKIYREKLIQIDEQVKAEINRIIKKDPQSLTAKILGIGKKIDIPQTLATQEEARQYYKTHYFDNIDLSDSRLLRSPALHTKVMDYMNFIMVGAPDSINVAVDSVNVAIDRVLDLAKPSEETFRYYLSFFLGHYIKESFVGTETIYVYLVDNYYAKGLAPWIEEEQLDAIKTDAAWLRNSLLGQQASNLTNMLLEDSTTINLYDVESEYTLLFFWRPECGACKKATPHVVDFYQKFKEEGVTVFTICTDLKEKAYKAWDFIEEKNFDPFINTIDPDNRSRFVQKYNARKTPKIFLLDKDKKIIIKNIGAAQLEEVMLRILSLRKNR